MELVVDSLTLRDTSEVYSGRLKLALGAVFGPGCQQIFLDVSNMKVGDTEGDVCSGKDNQGRWSELHIPVVFLNLQLNTAKLKLGVVFLQVELLIEIKRKRKHKKIS